MSIVVAPSRRSIADFAFFSYSSLLNHSEKGIKSWSEVRPMADAAQAVKDMHAGKARYRYVLKN